ncbi:MAG: type III pantothenate kinase [Chitinophagales bacterium]|nr:type III pantothenate kinase [Chitinophagales bacterium]MDW8420087.1 type III pantothenate kinase [Chitinophagales bacterium]
MQLAVDIGNTNIKMGLFNNYTLEEYYHQRDDLEKIITGKKKIKHIIVSRTGSDEWAEDLLKHYDRKFFVLSHELQLPIRLHYRTPETLGPDRIAGSVAANYYLPDTPVLKIDFGTCITYDFINPQNEYEGGAISPGIGMRLKALNAFTARLPLVDPLDVREHPVTGYDTATSILSGVIHGIRYEVRGMVEHYRERFSDTKVVVTGGDAAFFAAYWESDIFARPHLVLEGLNIILIHNIKAKWPNASFRSAQG